MNAKQIKILLINKGLTIADLARQISEVKPDCKLRSLETMISDTLYGKRYYPEIAAELETILGITIDRPKHLKPVREQLKQVA